MTTAAREARLRYGALWFGMLGAAAAWSVQEVASYALVAHSCYPRGEPLFSPSVRGTWVAALIVTAAAFVVALAALRVAWREWRRYRPEEHGDWRAELLGVREGAGRYLAFWGIVQSVIFGALILFNGIALFVVPTCSY